MVDHLILPPIRGAEKVVTYMTDAVRQLTILPLDTSALITDFTYLGVFAAVLATIGVVLSWRYLTK